MDSHIYEYAHLVSSWFLNFTASMTPSFDETEDALIKSLCIDEVAEWATISSSFVVEMADASRKRFIEHLKEEIIRLSCTGHPSIEGVLVERKDVLGLLSANK